MSLLGLKFPDSLIPIKSQGIQMSFKRHWFVSFLKEPLKFHSKWRKSKQIGFDVKQKQTDSSCFLSQRLSICPHDGVKSSYSGHWKILKEQNHTYLVSYSHRPDPSAWHTAVAE